MSESDVVLSRKVELGDLVVFIDGLTRTGKSMLGPILSSFSRVEMERMEGMIEYIGTLYRIKKISKDAAITLLRTKVDQWLYEGMIGRNTNFRFSDHSSVWKSSRVFEYMKRLRGQEGVAVLQRIRRERPIFQNQTHDQLTNFEFFYESLANGCVL